MLALHGRGANEESMLQLAQYLPASATVAAMRAPIAEGAGFAWFANRGIGRPIEESIKNSVTIIESWIDQHSQGFSGVVLLGFSGGTAMAGGLMLSDPKRYSAAVLLSGTLPWDAGFDTSEGVLVDLPVFWGNDVDDQVIPASLVERSEQWLREASGAQLDEHHYPGMNHGISGEEISDLSSFLLSVEPKVR